MTYQEVLHRHTLAISASNSPDSAYLGLSEEHLVDAMAELARHALALGARLLYGGDLRPGGFTELMFELVERHRRDAEHTSLGVTNFLAWPVHARMSAAEIRHFSAGLAGVAELVCLDKRGGRVPLERRRVSRREPTHREWAEGLSSMRRTMQDEADARLVLGGSVENFKGSMPGIAEEALMSLAAGTPLYLLGGFGGCARDIAETMRLVEPWSTVHRNWPGRESFVHFGPTSIRNGLSVEENRVLAQTPHIDRAIVLILKGLMATLERD